MGRIRLLSDLLIDRIAAGEVVERPASIVKELVENSLDAGASSIDVHLRGGGKQSIHVLDDGCGMDRDDALLALERHATSKLADADDLQAIGTLGFRGEALSSIAAVSRLTLTTAPAAGEGSEIEVHGGRVAAVRQVGSPIGTSIRVERLFYNVPARRKFLRTDATELSHALRWLTRYALARPDLRFRLRHGERALLDVSATGDLRGRIGQVHGREFADKLLPFDTAVDGLRAHGLAGRPVDALPRRDAQHLFVNGRAVQDRVLNHAVAQAYENTMARGRFAALFLFVDLEPTAVDVNVHPQKIEVRFRHSSQVHDFVRTVLAGALSRSGAVPSIGELRPTGVGAGLPPVAETGPGYSGGQNAPVVACGPTAPLPGSLPDSSLPVQAIATERRSAALAQYLDSYIVAQDTEGLVLVDQHAAHERVIFERYLSDAEENRVEVQTLLFPVTVELAPHERVVLERELAELRRLGFRAEPFGGNAVRLDAVPAVAAEVDVESLLRELLGQAAQTSAAAAGSAVLRRSLVTSAACQAAIKINHPLTIPAMQGLLDELYATQNPTTCPHGRPALFRITRDEIERAFRRR